MRAARAGRRRTWHWVLAGVAGVLALAFAGLVTTGLHTPASRASPQSPGPLTRAVRIEGGSVRGFRQTPQVAVFRGIPYAAPPVGDLRWRPPRPVVAWHGVRDCVAYGPSCPQGSTPVSDLPASQDEDCLYLNVWTPALSRKARLPVLVWIHGGGFISGSGVLPGPGGLRLAGLQRVVVVSVNYRLGVFGFFAHEGLSAESSRGVSGNYGLLDQRAALRWVRRNIAAFGGDPRRVTIFGQSAGGQSVMAHLVSPLSAGLFSAAIAESPRYQDHGVGTWNTLSLATQEEEGEWLQRSLGIADGPGEIEALRAVSAARLLRAAAPAPQTWPQLFVRPNMPSYQPVVDGWVLPDEEWVLLEQGRYNRVPVMIGTNRDECNMWAASIKPDRADAVAQAAQERVKWFTGPDYAELTGQFPESEYGGAMPATSRMMTVLEFTGPARYAARCLARRGTPAYLYYFTRSRPGDPWGARHGAELPYIFGAMVAPAARAVELASSQSGGSPERAAASTAMPATADERLSRIMMRYWSMFASTGDPNGVGQPRWPVYRPPEDRLVVLDENVIRARAPYTFACEVSERASQAH